MVAIRLHFVNSLLTLLVILENGCGTSAKNVSQDSRYQAGYHVGDELVSVDRLTLMRESNDVYQTGTPSYLVKPETVNDFASNRKGDHSVGVIEPGTRLRIRRLVASHVSPLPFYWHDIIRALAEFQSGPYAGSWVDVSEVSEIIYLKDLKAWVPAAANQHLNAFPTSR